MEGSNIVRILIVATVVVAIIAGFFVLKMKNKDGESVFFPTSSVSAKAWAEPTDFGNGVYYFEASGVDFGQALSLFLRSHSCKIEGMASGFNPLAGRPSSYFVVCR